MGCLNLMNVNIQTLLDSWPQNHFWLQTILRYHKLSFYYSLNHSVLHDEPSVPIIHGIPTVYHILTHKYNKNKKSLTRVDDEQK